jgi:hypothetical protein
MNDWASTTSSMTFDSALQRICDGFCAMSAMVALGGASLHKGGVISYNLAGMSSFCSEVSGKNLRNGEEFSEYVCGDNAGLQGESGG